MILQVNHKVKHYLHLLIAYLGFPLSEKMSVSIILSGCLFPIDYRNIFQITVLVAYMLQLFHPI